jgi:chain length determinant protein tyrosine kinase EpsG
MAVKDPLADTGQNPAFTTTGATRSVGRTIGSILVTAGRLTVPNVDEIRRLAATNKMRFGEAGLHLKLLTQEDIEFALARQYNYPIIPRGDTLGVSDEVVAAHDPGSAVVEGLRGIRSRLLLQPQSETAHTTLAIVSAERGEGRSVFAANLATVFAQTGARTLLIDADMRNPRQHELFRLPNETGLSALLSARAGMDVIQTIHPDLRLFVLTAGLKPPNPQELLSRSTFEALLARCAEQFKIVIVDTPATADTADAQVIAARAGAAVMLARRNHTHRARLSAASQCLVQSGVKLVGSVINDF